MVLPILDVPPPNIMTRHTAPGVAPGIETGSKLSGVRSDDLALDGHHCSHVERGDAFCESGRNERKRVGIRAKLKLAGRLGQEFLAGRRDLHAVRQLEIRAEHADGRLEHRVHRTLCRPAGDDNHLVEKQLLDVRARMAIFGTNLIGPVGVFIQYVGLDIDVECSVAKLDALDPAHEHVSGGG
jgi:hypothetical protein